MLFRCIGDVTDVCPIWRISLNRIFGTFSINQSILPKWLTKIALNNFIRWRVDALNLQLKPIPTESAQIELIEIISASTAFLICYKPN